MKIISKPEWGNWKLQIGCKRCEAVLEIDMTDIRAIRDPGDGPGRPEHIYYRCMCPVCKSEIIVPTEKLPKGIIALYENA